MMWVRRLENPTWSHTLWQLANGQYVTCMALYVPIFKETLKIQMIMQSNSYMESPEPFEEDIPCKYSRTHFCFTQNTEVNINVYKEILFVKKKNIMPPVPKGKGMKIVPQFALH